MAHRSITLYVEDNLDDAVLLERALKDAGYLGDFIQVGDGDEAQAYLRGDGRFSDRSRFPVPDVIICDIKMPRVSGHEFVRWLRQQPEFSKLPVFMFSSSGLMRDMASAMEEGANGFFVKPLSLERWTQTAGEMIKAADAAGCGGYHLSP